MALHPSRWPDVENLGEWLVVAVRLSNSEADRRAGAGRTTTATVVLPVDGLELPSIVDATVLSSHPTQAEANTAARRRIGAPA